MLTVRNEGANTADAASVVSNLADVLQNYQLIQVQTTGGAAGQVTPGEEPTRIFDTVSLPVGATITYTITGRPGNSPALASATDASLTLSVEVMPVAGSLEENRSNNAFLSQLLVSPAQV